MEELSKTDDTMTINNCRKFYSRHKIIIDIDYFYCSDNFQQRLTKNSFPIKGTFQFFILTSSKGKLEHNIHLQRIESENFIDEFGKKFKKCPN